MKSLISSLVMLLLAATGYATTVTVNASATGTTTPSVKTAGTILVNNVSNRGYAVFNLSAAGIPLAASITSVKLVFGYTISGLGTPSGNIYGYMGDISGLNASSLFASAVSSNVLYTASWGTTSGTVTMATTAGADTFIQHNSSNTISVTWVENASSRVYNITGGSNPYLQITYSCNNPASISGTTMICTGASTTLTDTTTGGTWSTGNASLATVTSTGNVTGIAQGIVAISYTKGGCSVTQLMGIKAAPSTITGNSNVCIGTNTTLSNTSILGTWSSSNTAIATVDAYSGRVTGLRNGAATIKYTTGCGTDATQSETVITTPATITGSSNICRGASATLNDTTINGAWSSSNSAIVSISATGVATGISQGIATITYNIASCISTYSLTVIAQPSPIGGSSAICNGSATLMTNTSSGGSWSSSNISIATISATTGVITGVSGGNTTITYTTGCGVNATKSVTVDLLPTMLVAPPSACVGNTVAVTETVVGGTWSSSVPSAATVNTSGVVTALSIGNTTIAYTMSNSCGTNSVNTNMTIYQQGYWLGTTSNNWNDASNWACSTIPDSGTSIVIPYGTPYLPNLSASTYTVQNLTLHPLVSISVNAGTTVNVRGFLTNNGTISGGGIIQMTSSSAQTIYGIGTVSNLTIKNPYGVTINMGDTVGVTNTLTLTTGVLTTNNSLTLVSNAFGTGRIAPITGGGITGNVNIEQFFMGGRRAFRFFAHPFKAPIALNMIGVNLDITGPGGMANGFTPTATNSPSCFRYDAYTGNSALPYDPGWKPFTKANVSASGDTNAIQKFEGVRLFVRGAKGEGLGYGSYIPSSATITMSGPVNVGTQTIPLHKGTLSDYNQVGNPYPSPTDIGEAVTAAQAAGQIAGAAFFVWNPFLGAAGAFEPKIIGSSYVLDQNSSFQVRATSDSATLTFNEANKSITGNETLLRSTPPQYISLKVYDENNHPWDMMYLAFNESATNNEDLKYDATKSINPDLNFYSLSANNVKLSVDARPYTSSTTIPLGFTTSYTQQYTIKAENMVLPDGATLYLHDKMLNKYVLLQAGTTYTFNINGDKATQGENRFELTTNNGTISIAANKGLNVTMSPNPATDNVTIVYANDASAIVNINIMTMTGVSVINKTIGSDATGKVTISLNELATGTYMVEVACGSNKKVQQLVKE